MIKTYEDWENSLDQNYVRQLSPDAWDLTGSAFEAGQQSQQAKIDELQVRVPEGYVVVPKEPTYEMCSELSRHLGRYMQMHDRYCPKTLKKYFDRFIGEPPEWLSKEVSSWDSDHAFATADLPVFIYKSMIEAA